MTPISHTVFALSLFLALCFLLGWLERRGRRQRRLREALAAAVLEAIREDAGVRAQAAAPRV